MASDEESLRALEALMTEFFDGRTTNERKRQIEEVLNNFSQQRDAWKHSLYYLTNTGNEYVMMYCMTVLENLINRQWVGLAGQDKMEIRSACNRHLLQHHARVPSYIRNKIVKLVVDIGRLDWPHFYPDFFSSILQLAQQPNTAALGLVLLQTTSEELACPREDLSIARKDELHKLLLAQVPNVLGILNNVLESILEKHQHLVSATPPPSPTHGQSADTGFNAPPPAALHSPLPLFNKLSPLSGSLLVNMFKSPESRVQTEALPPLDSSSHQLAVLCLNCLSHLFSWIPLSSTITPSLLSTIFHFAGFGCDATVTSHGSPPAGNGSFNSSFGTGPPTPHTLGVLAMCCINELLAKNCVPAEFEEFLLQMFQQTFYLLQRVTKETTSNSTGNRLQDLDENYVEKFTEFMRLFVSIHLHRFESNSQFPVLEFLALLFKYTFKQPTHEGFYSCLDIWGVFLDYLSTRINDRTQDNAHTISRYKEAFVSLVSQILHKIQFRYNQSHLEELDDDTLDDDSETEWQHYLRQCLETIAKIAELMPEEVFSVVYGPFQENLDTYTRLETFVSNGTQGRKLNVSAENECRKLHCALRDLSSLLQAIGRLAEHFIGPHFIKRFNDAHTLVDKLVGACTYSAKMKLYEVKTSAANVLEADFTEVHAQALAAVKANVSWLSQFYVESHTHSEQQHQCITLLNTILNTTLPLLSKQVPAKVCHSAAHLVLSVMTTVRPAYILQLPSIQTLYSDVSQGSVADLPLEVQLLVYRSLSNYLLLPWPGLPEDAQQWDARAAHHVTFLKQLFAKFLQLEGSVSALSDNKLLQEEAKPVIKRALHILTDLVEAMTKEGVVRSKQMCHQSTQSCIQLALALFPLYLRQPGVLDVMLGFFLSLFRGLRVQMGVAFTEQTLQTFITMFTRDQLNEIIVQETASGVKVVEKFLAILQVIVQEPGSAFKAFLPNIISICMDQIYPIVAERASPDIKPTLYQLLHQLLHNNWRHFFRGSVLTLMKGGEEEVENEAQFTAIMRAFGQSFLQPDIGVFRQNLETLESLNSKLKLYHKRIFKEVMLAQFLSVLIQVLVHKSHDLLQEEIGVAVYNMAAVDFDAFYANFLPHLLTTCEGLDDNQKAVLAANFKLEKDLPSFTQSIHRFVNDLRYYRLCNSSLPAGSVKF